MENVDEVIKNLLCCLEFAYKLKFEGENEEQDLGSLLDDINADDESGHGRTQNGRPIHDELGVRRFLTWCKCLSVTTCLGMGWELEALWVAGVSVVMNEEWPLTSRTCNPIWSAWTRALTLNRIRNRYGVAVHTLPIRESREVGAW